METEGAVIVREKPALTAVEIRSQVNLIQEVMKAVMQKDTHYGVIPGCQKPSLWKPGAEKLLVTFRIASEPVTEDLSTQECARYRVTRRGFGILRGEPVGAAVGECSSDEEKFKWRGAVCEAEFNATPETHRRLKYKRDGSTIKQVRTNPADVANTVLKMADKRAYVALALNVTAASDIFTQDIEDLPEGMEPHDAKSEPPAGPKVKDTAKEKTFADRAPDIPEGCDGVQTFIPAMVSKKEGETKGKKWLKYGIKSPEGSWYGTFDRNMGDVAEEAKIENYSITVGYKIDGDYNNVVTLVKEAL